MRTLKRAMLGVFVALICSVPRPASGGPQGAPGTPIEKGSIGGVL